MTIGSQNGGDESGFDKMVIVIFALMLFSGVLGGCIAYFTPTPNKCRVIDGVRVYGDAPRACPSCAPAVRDVVGNTPPPTD